MQFIVFQAYNNSYIALHTTFMQNLKSILFAALTVYGCATFSQDTAVYEVKTNLFSLGEMHAIHKSDKNIETYILESKVTVWSVYDVHYYLESKFENNILTSSLAKITANDKTRLYCQIQKHKDFYLRETDEKTDSILCKTIHNGITKLYFDTYTGPDSIFAELSGKFVSFKKKNDNVFILGEGKKSQEFVFNTNRVKKITAPNAFLDFFIILK